jgi:hypothetical protein
MYSYEERMKAIELYIKYDRRGLCYNSGHDDKIVL